MKDPRGLIILGEALGEDPTDPYPMGNEAFILDHLKLWSVTWTRLQCYQTDWKETLPDYR